MLHECCVSLNFFLSCQLVLISCCWVGKEGINLFFSSSSFLAYNRMIVIPKTNPCFMENDFKYEMVCVMLFQILPFALTRALLVCGKIQKKKTTTHLGCLSLFREYQHSLNRVSQHQLVCSNCVFSINAFLHSCPCSGGSCRDRYNTLVVMVHHQQNHLTVLRPSRTSVG